MYFFIGLLLGSMVLNSHQLSLTDCGDTYRVPEYTDISVVCGTSSIDLAILLCPVVFTGYNESLLILNDKNEDPQCEGELDDSVSPPVVRFRFPLNQTNACGSSFTTTSATGTGMLADFSNVQTVNVSGMVHSIDLTTGKVTYNTELKYYFSCAYPLEYIINNTRMDVSTSSIAVTDNNGSFISTLSMRLFADVNYTTPLFIPKVGLELRTEIFVEVKATNLTMQYNVHLDRCYASPTPQPSDTNFFNLFIACSRDKFTNMLENGNSHTARFSFPAFRFTEQQNQTVSTYYLHCITRLCESSSCAGLKDCGSGGGRKKRDVAAGGTSNSTTLSSPDAIITKVAEALASKDNGVSSGGSSSTGLGIAVGVLAAVVVVVAGMALFAYRRSKSF